MPSCDGSNCGACACNCDCSSRTEYVHLEEKERKEYEKKIKRLEKEIQESCKLNEDLKNYLKSNPMRKHKYKIQVFQCPECGNIAYAGKSCRRMTAPGHRKYLWCTHCKEIKNMVQIEKI